MYKAYIRPHVEYCVVQVWSPHQVNNIKSQDHWEDPEESYKAGAQPNKKLKELKLYPLEIRRLRGDLIEVIKIMNSLVEMKPEHIFRKSHNVQTRSQHFKLFKEPLNKTLSLRKYFLSQKVVDTWNDLPDSVVNVKTTNQFKNKIDDYWENHGYRTLK